MGYIKYYLYKKQYSTDNGQTWYDVTPLETTPSGDPIGNYSTLEECERQPPQYRTTSGTPYCQGNDKYIDIYSQVSYDGGNTWSTTATTTTLVERNSEDCRYIPPTPFDGKIRLSYTNGDEYTAVCDSNTTITSGETHPTGYTYSAMTSAVIGDCVTSIGDRAFYYCSGITSVTIPNSVTSIGKNAFYYCSGLTSIDIPDSVTSIGNDAFVYCNHLTGFEIPSGVTSIGSGVFRYCTSLTGITVNATTPPSIGTSAFTYTNSCPIYVPYNSVNAYKSAWSGYSSRITSFEQHRTTSGSPYCTGYDKYVDVYSQVSYDAGATWATASTTPTLVEAWSQDCGYVPLHRTTTGTPYCTGVDKYADVYNQVSYDNGTTWVTTATTATLVEHNSQDCGYMERTTSGNPYCVGRDKYVETFDQVSYNSGETWTTTSSAITLVETDSQDCGYSPIPSGVKARFSYINGDVYSAACDSNTTLTTGDTQPAGYSYPAMGFVEIGSCITSIGYYAFSGCTSLTSIDIPDSVTSIGSEAFSGCTSLRSINIPDNVTSINYRTFHYCSGLTSCTIGSGVTSIGTGAFGYCSSLTSVTIPDSVTSIGSSAFWNCDGITSIDNMQNVTSIGWGAFYDCDSLTGVTIGSSITSIDGAAFSQCVNLTSVTVLATTPPTLGDNVFFTSTGVHVTIYVPAGSVETYKTASGWSTYASRIQAIP